VSEKNRQEKDDRGTNKKRRAMREHQPSRSLAGKDKDPEQYEGLAGTDVKSKPGVRGVV